MKATELTLLEKCLAAALGIITVGVIVIVFNFIPYLLWNKGVAPLFGWRTFTFWQIFVLCWALSWIGRIVLPSHKK